MVDKIKEVLEIEDKNLNMFENLFKNGYLTKRSLNNLINDVYDLDENKKNKIDEILEENLNRDEEVEASLSIIVSTYNRVDKLKECIRSIFNQTYKNYEILIIDDASTDGTEKYCKTLLNSGKVSYFKNSKNMGQAYGRKKYYHLTKGKYIIFCDDDDYYIDNRFFEEAINIFESNKFMNCVCANSLKKYENENVYEFEPLNFGNMITAYKYLEDFQTKYKKPNSTFTTVFKRYILLKNGILDMNMINDASIYFRSLMSNGKVALYENIVGIYRIHESNLNKKIKTKFIIETLNEKKSIYQFLKEYAKEIDCEIWYERQIIYTLKYYMKNAKCSKNFTLETKNWVLENTNKEQSFNIIKKLYIDLIKGKFKKRKSRKEII